MSEQDRSIKRCPRCNAESHVVPGVHCVLKNFLENFHHEGEAGWFHDERTQFFHEEMQEMRDLLKQLELRAGGSLRDVGVVLDPKPVPMAELPEGQRVAMVEEWLRQIRELDRLIVSIAKTFPVIKHRSYVPFHAICGANVPNQHTVNGGWEGVNCPGCLRLKGVYAESTDYVPADDPHTVHLDKPPKGSEFLVFDHKLDVMGVDPDSGKGKASTPTLAQTQVEVRCPKCSDVVSGRYRSCRFCGNIWDTASGEKCTACEERSAQRASVPNRNGDIFPSEALKEASEVFIARLNTPEGKEAVCRSAIEFMRGLPPGTLSPDKQIIELIAKEDAERKAKGK